ncbi:MAG: hypothetical protein K9L88_10655, partial [Chromatiaceae bacterium]|nr:hypothetical protein [Chromatiaceae bacterium]
MPLKSDQQGFLVGEPLAREDVLEALEGIRDELKALRRELSTQQGAASDNRATPAQTTSTRAPSLTPIAS